MKKAGWRIGLSLAVSALCLYAVTLNVQWQELKRLLQNARLLPVLIASGISLFTFGLRAQRWRMLLAPFQKISPLILFRWHVGGLFLNSLLPLRIGELARAYWAGHKTSISKSTILATIVAERLMDLVSLVTLAAPILLLTGLGGGLRRAGGILLFGLLAAGLGLVLARRILGPDPVGSALRIAKSRFPEKVGDLAERFLSGLKIFQNAAEVAKLFLLSVGIWAIDIGALAVMSRSLELNLNWIQGALTMVGLILGVMVPAAPGAAGTYEAGGVAALALMGFDKTRALSFVFLLHVFQYLMILAMGIPVFLIEGFRPRQILADLKRSRDA